MRKNHRVLLSLTLLSLLLLACGGVTATPTPTTSEQVTIARVVDGDSVELTDGRRVRYQGINAPEWDQPFFQEATEANRRLVAGKTARMELDVQPTDRFGRILAYLWVDDSLVNVELVRQGYANAYTAPPNVRYSQEIVAAEREAREAESGLWARAGIPVRIKRIHYDAPGRDSENPNGEWVEIVNEGSATVNLAGFTLKDEANHIYTFPARTLRPGQVLKLHSGQGHDNDRTAYWGLSNDAIWNNTGDTAYLREPQGWLVDSFSY